MAKIKESDLFSPLKTYLIQAGYDVKAEVNGCDITASREEEIIIIELKLSLNLALILQAIDRQKISDSVYVAVPAPTQRAHRIRLHKIKKLLKRLELGLIYVDLASKQIVKIIFHPQSWQRRQQAKRRRALLKEIALRSGNGNIGGSRRKKNLTAYRENALKIAAFLDVMGEHTPAGLRKMGCGEKTLAILNSNFYGWFTRVSRGVYRLNERGRTEINEWQEIVKIYQAECKDLLSNQG